jgi:hypothetical protein
MSFERMVSLKIDGDIAVGGRVPLDVLAAKIQALQNLILATAPLTRPALPKATKGAKTAQQKVHAKDACRLYFKETRKNCLTLEAELQETSALFPEEADWGVQTADVAGEVLWAIQAKDEKRLSDLAPDPTRRLGIIRRAESLLPTAGGHTITIRTPHQSVEITSQVIEFIHRLEAQIVADRKKDQRTVAGRVTRIDTLAKPAIIGIQCGASHLTCELLPETIPQVEGSLTTGTVVEVTGKALLTKRSKVRRLIEATHVRQLGQEPVHWTRITHEDREFELHLPLDITVQWDGMGWVFEAEALGIIGFGQLRREAMVAFGQDFAACWDNIALAEDSDLTQDALEMKKALRALVKSAGGVA